ncbi:hypothetical protein [Streptomyces sp. NPDC048361]|uniref:hypothetical protein n=1 Tax=Streptomyces sp. NPDC048361 TaxID=3154720 RepID=UPI0034454FB1
MRVIARVLVAVVVMAVMAAGCSQGIAVPKAFCDVPVRPDSLSPLLPSEGEVKTSRSELHDVICNLSVGGSQTLNVRIAKIDKQLPPEDWANAQAEFTRGARRTTSFPGTAVIGSNGALVTANCGKPSAYILLDVAFTGKRAENSEVGAQRLQRFLEDFVPSVTQKLGCTGQST